MRSAPSEKCDYVSEGSAADPFNIVKELYKLKINMIVGCSAVGSALALRA